MSGNDDQSERRVRETLSGQGDEGNSDEIDPVLMARLEAWFGGPATGSPPPPPEPRPETKTQRAKALDAVDPGLLERLERQGERSGALVEPLPPPEPFLDPSISRFELAAWGLQGIGELREIERSEAIQDAVQQRTPQALLRDLHRPVRFYGDIYLRPVDLGVDVCGVRARAAIADLVYHRRYRVNPVREPNGRRIMNEEEAELRGTLQEPWANSKPSDPRPVPSEHPDENDLRWFGAVGVDPDQ